MDEQLQWALARFPQPAFYTEDGIVRWSNPAAQPAVFPGLALERLMDPPELPPPRRGKQSPAVRPPGRTGL